MRRVSLTGQCMLMISVGMIPTNTSGIQTMALGQRDSLPGMLLACCTGTEDKIYLMQRLQLRTCKIAHNVDTWNTCEPWRETTFGNVQN